MFHATQNVIPAFTSEAGSCLTSANWQEVQVTAASYSLEHLLYKPGYDVLKKITDLAHYLNWSGGIVLNAMSLVANKEGVSVLKSPYDGAKITLSCFDLLELIRNLKPNAVALPKNIVHHSPQIWSHWNEAITPFLHVHDLEKQELVRTHGAYFNVSSNQLDWKQLERWSHIPRYVAGDFDPVLIRSLRAHKVDFIETNEPAKSAMQGKVYSRAGHVDLADENTRMLFETIDTDCACPTCSQQFTKAYIHHLLQHTPLLCQRFLIQHNMFYIQTL